MVEMMKILLLSRYPRVGASSRLRLLQYTSLFEASGFCLTVESLFDEEYLRELYGLQHRSLKGVAKLYVRRLITLLGCHKYDLIWIEKEVYPYLPATVERVMALLGKPYIVDYDDAVFHNYDLAGNTLVRRLLGGKIDKVMRYSNYVIAGNQYLAERAAAAGARRVAVVPTVVDHKRYAVKDYSLGDRPVIGWIGSPSTEQYILEIRTALISVCKHFNAHLVLIGASTRILEKLSGIDVEIRGWTEEGEADLIRQIDVGIMPLRDGPWERGKCGYKLIQYMACGIPVVASPVGVNVEIVNESGAGILAGSLPQWESALCQLLASRVKRRELGLAGRKAVETKYSLCAQGPVLTRIFSDVINTESK